MATGTPARIALAACAASTALVLSACGDDTERQSPASSCDENKDMTTVVSEALATLPDNGAGGWRADADVSALSPCGALSAAWTIPQQSSNTSPVAILLFHEGEYVGLASDCMATIESVANTGDDAVTVTYRYLNPGDSNVSMTGRAVYTFTWDDGQVLKEGHAPARMVDMFDCEP